MNRKADFGFSQIVIAVLMLTVVITGGKIVYDLSGEGSQYLLGQANIKTFDQGIIDRYNQTSAYTQDATNSVKGFIYAVNSLAYLDTYKDNAFSKKILGVKFNDDKSLTTARKSFGGVQVEPTYYDRETVTPAATASVESVKESIGLAVLSCWFIFEDKGNEPTRCFALAMPSDYPAASLTELDGFMNAGVASYLGSHKLLLCEQFSKKYSFITQEVCLEKIGGLAGDGMFDVEDIDQGDVPANFFTTLAPKGELLSICADPSWLDEVTLHGGAEDACDAPTNALSFGYKVKGFSLPQDVTPSSSGFTNAVETLTAYGDPQYLLFYEKFPADEAQYWETSSYQIAWGTILAVEGGFALVDVITMGMGSKFGKTLLAPFKNPVTEVTGNLVKKAVSTAGQGATRLIKGLFSTPIEFLVKRTVMTEAVQESAEIAFGKSIRGLLGSADDAVAKELAEKLAGTSSHQLKELLEGADKHFVKDGVLTTEGERELLDRLNKKVFITHSTPEIPFSEVMEMPYYKLVYQRAEQLAKGGDVTEELFEQAQREASQKVAGQVGKEIVNEASLQGLRSVPREAVRVYRAGMRGQNLLKEILLGDMTEEARKEALIKVLKAGDADILAKMSPLELRAFLSNQGAVKKMLFDEKTGKVILGAIGKDFTEEAQQQALKRLDTILASKTIDELAPRSGIAIQTFLRTPTSSIGRIGGPLAMLEQKRHLVAVLAGIAAARIESMAEKNYPVGGANSIGLKSPYFHTIPYTTLMEDVTYPEINAYIANSPDPALQKKLQAHQALVEKTVLPNYGERNMEGLLPEVERYYLSLTKDQGVFSQDPERFYLASPCQADLLLEVSSCECYYTEDAEAGIFETGDAPKQLMGKDENGNDVATGKFVTTPHFDGKNSMLYTLDSNSKSIKECHSDTAWFHADTLHKPLCIKVNPIVENYGTDNYCYHGISDSDEAISSAITAAQIGLPFLGLLCGPAAPACIAGIMAAVGFGTGVVGEAAKGAIAIDSQWPNHD
ncbi:MAG: hypothetical protein Q7S65_01990 [Nanoarchaeota archaeon]|nr:hypothetical protein [Nanoarchaeota archaeon]